MRKLLTIPLLLLGLASSMVATVALPASVSASRSACSGNFFGLPAWYDGLTEGANCEIKKPDSKGLATFVWRIALNVIEAGLMLIGYASVAFIIVGGFRYMTATGQPDKIKAAKDTIRNAVIGLVVAMSAVAIVNVIAGAL